MEEGSGCSEAAMTVDGGVGGGFVIVFLWYVPSKIKKECRNSGCRRANIRYKAVREAVGTRRVKA